MGAAAGREQRGDWEEGWRVHFVGAVVIGGDGAGDGGDGNGEVCR